MRALKWSVVTFLAVVGVGCGPAKVEPGISLSASPRTINGTGGSTTITVTAVDDVNKPGTGTVRITSPAGSLSAGTEVDLLAGEGSVMFTCDRSVDPACNGSIRITGEWVFNGTKNTATTNVTVSAATDAGTDGGSTDAGIDAGPLDDGGVVVTITSDKMTIIAGVGDPAIITATVADSVGPLINETVTFTASEGRVGTVGGSGSTNTFTAMTDTTGQARAQLTIGATDAGSTTVNASAAGSTGAVRINIASVSNISFSSSECPQTLMNCNLMGIQGSGFNETAQVKFIVSDGTNRGVAGVPVTFTLVGAPSNTSVDATAVTNADGVAVANVRSGRTVGTFTVRATAPTGISVESFTIGVRGAKPSNRGFKIVSCNAVNLAAYVSPAPPLPITVTCTVKLIDRYGNPVGTGTQVRLNSEAGTVPNNVTTTPFSGTGNGEGEGSFTFQTTGTWPAVDVPVLTAVPGQYPYPRRVEPSTADGALTRNPRDGLVTIIAYLQGEEDFVDDNNNGVRDQGEQFIDQGEPFVDSNDNNVRDQGEPYIDSPQPDGGAPNGSWDAPNGVWDSNAQIWTDFRILYTDRAAPALSNLTLGPTRTSPSGYGTVPVDSQVTVNVFMPDKNLNFLESSSGLAASLVPATRGSAMVVTPTLLDGYGFDYERVLLNANGTGACAPTTEVCAWRSVFGAWGEGAVTQVVITAGTSPATPTPEVLTVKATTRAADISTSANGIVQ